MKGKTVIAAAWILISSALWVSATTPSDIIQPMTRLIYALGWLMLTILGVKWVTAESTQERLDTKKGMVYIVVGLLIVRVICNLIAFYCQAAQNSMALGGVGFSCASAAIGC